jgi:GntR family transcriptional repressor for pyruvate dehydrogenase complex
METSSASSLGLEPVTRAPANPPAVAVAREMIRWLTQSGELAVGEKLPSERELTAIFRVGRSAVREALKTLSLLGLVEIRPGSGTYLRGWSPDLLPQVLAWDMMLGESRGREMMEARTEVEVALAGLAATRRTDEELQTIREAQAALAQAGAAKDLEEIARTDIGFHLAIAQAAHSTVLAEFLGRLQNFLRVWIRRAAELNPDLTARVVEHAKIVEAIAAADPEAAREAAREHMRSAFAAFEPGSAHRLRLDIAAVGEKELQRLVDTTHETSQVAVLEGTEAVYVARVDGTHSLRLISEVGRRLPASCTAIGKALLAGLSEPELEARLGDAPLPTLTDHSITDRNELRRQLAAVRTTGVAHDDSESNEGVRCVAAPVHNALGTTIAAISTSVPTVRWTPETEARLTTLVIEAATRISQTLATSSWTSPTEPNNHSPTSLPGSAQRW